MIPKIIHQTWKDENLPPLFSALQKQLKALHPNWEYRLWTDSDNRSFVETYYPELLSVYDALPKHIMRVDVIRYLIMDKIGGFYCDLDYEMVRSVDEVIQDCELLLPLSQEQDGVVSEGLGNSVFASAPGHVFWQDTIADLLKNPPLAIEDQNDVIEGTGPGFLTRIYYQNPDRYQAFTPPKLWFHPPSSWAGQPDYQTLLRSAGSYGIHHCTGSWRGFNSKSNFFQWHQLKLKIKLRLPTQLIGYLRR